MRLRFHSSQCRAAPAVLMGLLLLPLHPLTAQLPTERAEALAELMGSLRPLPSAAAAALTTESPLWHATSDGTVSYVGAPPSRYFAVARGAPGTPEATARQFLRQNARLFGVADPSVDFTLHRLREKAGRHYVRLQQTYAGIPVFAALATVQVREDGGVACMLADLARDLPQLAAASAALGMAVNAATAEAVARQSFAGQAPELLVGEPTPRLTIFAPAVLDEGGDVELVWEIIIHDPDKHVVHHRVLVSAMTGRLVRAWTLNPEALNRQISDKSNSQTNNAVLIRAEGQPASGNTAVDNCYDYFGDVYDYYNAQHGRDSFDGGGGTLAATVNYCDTNAPCPWANATANLRFGAGWAADDVVAHEFTHNVTAWESGLIYTNVSGAIDEFLCDAWGEFVDLWNNRGNDSAAVRWDVGEDINGPTQVGRIRSMSFPTNLNNPDRLGSPFYQPPSNTADNGGVHNNSGVGNKMCYLLTDGDTFNGYTVHGLSQPVVANLLYEVQVNFLTPGASWADLYNALRQAALNLGLSEADRNNVARACFAVEIASFPAAATYVDGPNSCPTPDGAPVCTGNSGPFPTVGQGISAAPPGNAVVIRAGAYRESVNTGKFLELRAENGVVTIGN